MDREKSHSLKGFKTYEKEIAPSQKLVHAEFIELCQGMRKEFAATSTFSFTPAFLRI